MTYSSSNKTRPDSFLKKFFNKEPEVYKGQLGVCKYTWGTDTRLKNSDNSQQYNVYAKVEAVHVYDNLVEVKMIDLEVFDSINENILDIIKAEFNTFVDPRDINWEKYENNINSTIKHV